jgi:nicotinamidase-related amidase
MKRKITILLIFFLASLTGNSQDKIKIQNDTLPTALLVIDIQDFYFPGGKLPLTDPEEASARTAEVEKLFRDQNLPVIIIQHAGGSPIHKDVTPLNGEKVITKKEANSFAGTELLDYLRSLKIKRLVICGMQTQMCVEATTRAAYDYGFKCLVVQDACAARPLKFGERIVTAADVHATALAILNGYYAKVVNSKELE